MGRAGYLTVLVQHRNIAHGVPGHGDQCHPVGVGVQGRHQDHVRLVVAAIGQGRGRLIVGIHADQQQIHHMVLIAVVFAVVEDGVAVQLLRAAGGNGGGRASVPQTAAPVEPDARHNGAQHRRHRHEDDENQQRRGQALFLPLHRGFLLFLFHRGLLI